MFRWSRRILTLFSFILFATSATMAVRSYRVTDFVAHQNVNRANSSLIRHERILVSGRGGVCMGMSHTIWKLPHRDLSEAQISGFNNGWQHERLLSDAYAGDFFKATKQSTTFGFGRAKVQNSADGFTQTSRLLVLPWGAPMLVSAVLPFIAIIRFIKSRRRLRRLAALNYNGMQTRHLAA
jgi:hypothetical protein